MKAKTIKAVLTNKIDSWLDSISDETVRKLAARDPDKVNSAYLIEIIDRMF